MTSFDRMPVFGQRTGLWLLALLSGGIYLAVTLIGPEYDPDVPHAKRPILLVLGLFSAAFVFYLAALILAVHLPGTKRFGWWIFGTSVMFRAILLPSPPFMEIDLYRYAWDGIVAANGESPFRYSPLQVRLAASKLEFGMSVDDPALVRLASLVRSDEQIAKVLGTVHYAELRSVYPPVSQTVFFATAHCTPTGASVEWRVFLVKLAMVLFDLATLGIVFGLLRLSEKPIGWAIAYGWCPLVLKEFSNSGHLDAIAVALSMAAIWATAASWRLDRRSSGWTIMSSGLLALAVGAKLYPIVLAPLFFLSWWRKGSWRLATSSSAVLVIGILLCLMPMQNFDRPTTPSSVVVTHENDLPPPPADFDVSDSLQGKLEGATVRNDGLLVFLQQWEMNDLFFSIVVENLRSQENIGANERPWFALMPDSWSTSLVTKWSAFYDYLLTTAGADKSLKIADNPRRASFLLARMVTGVLFFVVAVIIAWRATREQAELNGWMEAAFLTLAWFWLLAPTQNPWYWCWAVPLLPFARGRTWIAVSGFVLVYYLRFWLKAHFDAPPLLGTPYNGVYFFHYVVVWWEHGPYLLWLFTACCWRVTMRSKSRD